MTFDNTTEELSKRVGRLYKAFGGLCRIIIKPERIANIHQSHVSHLIFISTFKIHYCFFFKQTPEATFTKVTYDLQIAKAAYFFLCLILFDLCRIYNFLTSFLKLTSLDFSNSTIYIFLHLSTLTWIFLHLPHRLLLFLLASTMLTCSTLPMIIFPCTVSPWRNHSVLQLDLCLSVNKHSILFLLNPLSWATNLYFPQKLNLTVWMS